MTGHDDASQQERIARRTAALGLLHQAAYASSQLLATGIISRAVAADQFGLWLTVFALTTWVPLLSIGQYAVLLTTLGSVARRDRAAATRAYGASFAIAASSACVVLAALLFGAPWTPWPAWLNADTPALAAMTTPVVMAMLGATLLAVPLTLMGFAVFAHQRGDLVHLAMISGSVAGTLALLLAAATHQPLWVLGATAVAGPLLGGLWIAWRHAGGRYLPRLALGQLHRSDVGTALKMGLALAAADLLLFAIVRTPDLVVARLHGLDAVGPFGAVGRVPVLLLAVFQALMLPYWPALADAVHQGDVRRVRRIAVRSLATILGIWAAVSVVLVGWGLPLFRVWLGDGVQVQQPLLVAACGQSLGIGLLAWLMVVLNAQVRTRTLLATLAAAACIYVALAVWLGLRSGPVGVAHGQVIGMLAELLPVAAWQLRELLRAAARVAHAPVVGGRV